MLHVGDPGVRDVQKRQLLVQAAAYLETASDDLEKARQGMSICRFPNKGSPS
jgi:hypothetical protein